MQTKKRLAELENDDINADCNSSRIELNYLIEGKVYNYYRGIDRNQKRTHNKSKLDGIIKTFTNEYVDEWKNENDGSTILIKKEKPMPVFANYGVNRAVMDMPKLETGRNYKKN